MEAPRITLASASPRRRRLMQWLGVPYRELATDVPEDLTSPLRHVPPVLARSLAADKARAAASGSSPGIVAAFDTIVVLDGEVLGKPVDRADAARMLGALSGRVHQVVTGVALLPEGTREPMTFAVTTDVQMAELDAEALDAWLAGDEALGCAGAYNIERHLASVGDDECYQNVAGLPLCHLYQRLAALGIEAMTSPIPACDAALQRTCALGPTVCGRPSPRTGA